MTPMDTLEILQTSEQLHKLLIEIFEQKNMVEAEIAELEREHSDIIHRFEKSDCKYKERARLATRLATMRRERRILKDWLLDNRQYFDFLGEDNGKQVRKMIENLVGRGRKVQKAMARYSVEEGE